VSETTTVIEANGLSKTYGRTVAVRSLDLSVRRGEVFGFLGPNGAGKTTALKMLLGLVQPTAGTAQVMGLPPELPESRARVGFLPENASYPLWMRGDEFLDAQARLCGVDRRTRRERIPQLLAQVGLTEAASRRLSTYSKGMIQRAGFAAALVHAPDLLFLDEPTSGLDPLGRRLILRIIQQLHSKGKTIVLNSHLLPEVDQVCTRVAIMNHGMVREERELGRGYSAGPLRVDLCVDCVDEALILGLAAFCEHVEPAATNSSDGQQTLSLFISDESQLPRISRWVVQRGTSLFSLTPRPMTLDEVFVAVTTDEEQP
jgi:ABC-2 type transport system ATP-binding protein